MNCSLCGHARNRHSRTELGAVLCLPTCAFCEADLVQGELTPGCPVCDGALASITDNTEQLPTTCDSDFDACPNERCWRERRCRRT